MLVVVMYLGDLKGNQKGSEVMEGVGGIGGLKKSF